MAEVLIDIPDDIAAAIELLIDNNIEFIRPALLRQVLYVIAGKIPGPSDGSFTAVAPLNYDPFTNQFIISQAGTATNGYLSKEDYVKFSAKTVVGIGETLFFKNPANNNPTNAYVLEVGDIGQRFIETGVKIEGVYLGGNPDLESSWRVQTEIEP